MNQDQDQDQNPKKDWRELCKAAATEFDSEKLMGLVAEINRALDERESKRMALVENTEKTKSENDTVRKQSLQSHLRHSYTV